MAVLRGFSDAMKSDSPEMSLVSINDLQPGDSEPIQENGKSKEWGSGSAANESGEDPQPGTGKASEPAPEPKAKKKPAPRNTPARKKPAQPTSAEKAKPASRKSQPKPDDEDAGEDNADPETDDGQPAQRPHYSKMVRKELRLFQDQSVDLKIKSMKIHNAKFGVGERITDNTLVRIAVDMLLQREDELQGTTEQELRESMGLPPRY